MGGVSSKSPPNGGLRVHRVYPNGPGDVAGIEPFFDYVLDADGYTYTDDSDETLNLFTKYVNDHENQQICLNVYNARKKSIREVFIVPQKWDGIGLLGLTLKFGLFTCLDQGAHIIHIYDKSPAQKAGLMPITDYLLGTNLQLFIDLDCVRIHVANQVDKEVVLIVYNSVTETVRRAVIVPKENWGGKGTLGCDLAKGYIHRIPYVKSLFTYPSIDTYPTFDSNLSKEVVDTIDLSIGNVDNYYNSSNNTTLRQDLMTSERTDSSLEKSVSSPTNNNSSNRDNTSGNLDSSKDSGESSSTLLADHNTNHTTGDDNNRLTGQSVVDNTTDRSNTDATEGFTNNEHYTHSPYTPPPSFTENFTYNYNRDTEVLEHTSEPTVESSFEQSSHFSYDTMNLGDNQTLDLGYNNTAIATNTALNINNLNTSPYNATDTTYPTDPAYMGDLSYNNTSNTTTSLTTDNTYTGYVSTMGASSMVYTSDHSLGSTFEPKVELEVDPEVGQSEPNSDHNDVDLNNIYQPPSMLNLDFTNFNSNFTDTNSFVDPNNLDTQVDSNNFNNPENLVNPLYNNQDLFTQDKDNV